MCKNRRVRSMSSQVVVFLLYDAERIDIYGKPILSEAVRICTDGCRGSHSM